jgi:hypothetical protein
MNSCEDSLFSMKMDIYYSIESQDKFGKEVKSWFLDRTIIGYAEVLGAVEKDGLKASYFFEYTGKLIGRSKEDPRISMDGLNYPITSIIITNIADAKTGKELYTESAGERSGQSTIFEVSAIDPYVNPWNDIEYYKILFNRSEVQVLSNG